MREVKSNYLWTWTVTIFHELQTVTGNASFAPKWILKDFGFKRRSVDKKALIKEGRYNRNEGRTG